MKSMFYRIKAMASYVRLKLILGKNWYYILQLIIRMITNVLTVFRGIGAAFLDGEGEEICTCLAERDH